MTCCLSYNFEGIRWCCNGNHDGLSCNGNNDGCSHLQFRSIGWCCSGNNDGCSSHLQFRSNRVMLQREQWRVFPLTISKQYGDATTGTMTGVPTYSFEAIGWCCNGNNDGFPTFNFEAIGWCLLQREQWRVFPLTISMQSGDHATGTMTDYPTYNFDAIGWSCNGNNDGCSFLQFRSNWVMLQREQWRVFPLTISKQ